MLLAFFIKSCQSGMCQSFESFLALIYREVKVHKINLLFHLNTKENTTKNPMTVQKKVLEELGFEPRSFCLRDRHSTAELHPRLLNIWGEGEDYFWVGQHKLFAQSTDKKRQLVCAPTFATKYSYFVLVSLLWSKKSKTVSQIVMNKRRKTNKK